MARTRWDRIVWPRWVPVRARLPLLAQICGAFALVAAITMPQYSELNPEPIEIAAAPAPLVPAAAPVVAVPAASAVSDEADRPAHLNLDVRYTFRNLEIAVAVDDKRVLATRLEGSGKRFGVFGKREERSFTRTLDLDAGVRVVRVNVKSAEDKFDHTRIERFELGSASVASMRVVADRTGLTVFADHPPIVREAPAPPPVTASMLPLAHDVKAAAAAPVVPRARATPTTPIGELYRSLRSILIAVAGFIATTAAGFFVQEFLISRKRMLGL